MAFIEGDCSLKLLYLIIYISLGLALRTITYDENNKKFIEIINNLNTPTIISFLQILFYFLDNLRKKRIKNEEIEELKKKEKKDKLINLNDNVINNLSNKEKKIKLKLFLLLILSGLSESIRLLYKLFLIQGKRDISYFISGPLLLEIMILSYFILNVKSYQHHYFCVIFMFIADFLLGYKEPKEDINIINLIITMFDKMFENYKQNIFDFFFSAPRFCLEKYMMHYLFANPYLIIYFEGIIQIIVILFVNLSYIIYYYFKNEPFKYLIDQKLYVNELLNHWIIIPVYFLILVTLKFLELIINQEFGPTYLIIASTCFIYRKFYDVIFYEKKTFNNSIQKTSYIIYAIIPFLFCEIIIFNFLGFGKNARKIVSKRERNESKILEDEIKQLELTINMV